MVRARDRGPALEGAPGFEVRRIETCSLHAPARRAEGRAAGAVGLGLRTGGWREGRGAEGPRSDGAGVRSEGWGVGEAPQAKAGEGKREDSVDLETPAAVKAVLSLDDERT